MDEDDIMDEEEEDDAGADDDAGDTDTEWLQPHDDPRSSPYVRIPNHLTEEHRFHPPSHNFIRCWINQDHPDIRAALRTTSKDIA